MTYFTSDQHFGRFNIIRLCQRPFASLEEMNEVMLAKWNAKVKDSDRVFILGDLFFLTRDPEGTLRLLKGRKTLILVNHDSSWTGKVDLARYFENVYAMLETSDGEHTLTLCHYPMMTLTTVRGRICFTDTYTATRTPTTGRISSRTTAS